MLCTEQIQNSVKQCYQLTAAQTNQLQESVCSVNRCQHFAAGLLTSTLYQCFCCLAVYRVCQSLTACAYWSLYNSRPVVSRQSVSCLVVMSVAAPSAEFECQLLMILKLWFRTKCL